jgi:hypothetical protein
MWFYAVTQVLYAAIWIGVIVGSVIFLRRGYGSGAIFTLLGAAILLLSHGFFAFRMVLEKMHVAQGFGGRYSGYLMQTPHLLGMVLFAVGFVQLARETSLWMENQRAGQE